MSKWIEIEYKDYSRGYNEPTICHAIINADMITEFHIEDKAIKGHADLYYELTDDCFDYLMTELDVNRKSVKMYSENWG